MSRSRLALAALALSAAFVSCQSGRLSQRSLLAGTSPAVRVSPYVPEEGESCQVVDSPQKCPYWSNPFKDQTVSCGEHMQSQAETLNANYIYVKLPSSSVGGFQTSSATATFYRCESLLK